MACVTQLIYHPAFDPYNALLRTVRVLAAIPKGVDSMALRILEFYLLFPEQLVGMRLSPKLRSAVRRLSASARYPYDRLPASRSVFERMGSSFDAALQTLSVRGLVDVNAFAHVTLRADQVPKELADLIREQNEEEKNLMSVLTAIASEFATAGSNGLKDRSGLAEYRYDVV